MNELQSKEIYDSAGNVIPDIADKHELASSIYELSLQYSKDDYTLKTAVCLTILLDLNLPEAWKFTLEVARRRVSK